MPGDRGVFVLNSWTRCLMKFDVSLYLVTGSLQSVQNDLSAFLQVVEQAVAGGVTLVQLRDKNLSPDGIAQLGRAMLKILRPRNIPLIVNDHVQVAQAIGADGVHVGARDMSVAAVRRILGAHSIVGVSIEDADNFYPEHVVGADYIAASPVFHTHTKNDIAPPLGLDGLKQLRHLSALPLVAIGGINLQNLESVLNAGANGVAVVSSLFHASSPFHAAQNFISIIQECKTKKDVL